MLVVLRWRVVAVSLLVTALPACANGSPPAAAVAAPARAKPGEPVTVSLADSGGAVTIPVGGVLVVRLPAPPASGHAWQLAAVDRDVLEAAEPATELADAGTDHAPRERVFSFTGKRAGATHLEIALRRPFEPVPIRRTFTLEVTVK